MIEGANIAAVMTALAEKAAAELDGTCRTLHELGEEYEGAGDSAAFCARLDELVFCCDGCGWWCSTDELHNMDGVTQKCDDCTDEGEDE